MDKITVDTNKDKLNKELIHNFLSNSYWAKDRSYQKVIKCIENSMNFGIYKNEEQIGYARVVTDYTIFAYLLDVFIIESERGKGHASTLLNEIMNHDKLQYIDFWRLATADAQAFYQKFKFTSLKSPEKMMERWNINPFE